jgi:hypothetical protein
MSNGSNDINDDTHMDQIHQFIAIMIVNCE